MKAPKTRIATQLVLVVSILATIACDRVTKHIATETLAGSPARSYLGDTIWIGYAENAGGFLGLGANLPPRIRIGLFTVGLGLLLLASVAAAIRLRWRGWPLFGFSLFVAGGASNWVDRVVRGSVVDFMNVGIGPLRTGIFNVADVAIMLGLGILVLAELLPQGGDESSSRLRGGTA
jgi:signal peptidase II